MKETIAKIPDESLLKKTKALKKESIPEKISSTYLFGKWKNLNIDAKKIREEAWERSHKL